MLALFLLFTTLTTSTRTSHGVRRRGQIVTTLRRGVTTRRQRVSGLGRNHTTARRHMQHLTHRVSSQGRLLRRARGRTHLLHKRVSHASDITKSLNESLSHGHARCTRVIHRTCHGCQRGGCLACVFSSHSFTSVTHGVAGLQRITSVHRHGLRSVTTLSGRIIRRGRLLSHHGQSLSSMALGLGTRGRGLRHSTHGTHADVQRLSRGRGATLRHGVSRRRRLSITVNRLHGLAGNGGRNSSFSAGAANLQLPIATNHIGHCGRGVTRVANPGKTRIVSVCSNGIISIGHGHVAGGCSICITRNRCVASCTGVKSVYIRGNRGITEGTRLNAVNSTIGVVAVRARCGLIFNVCPPGPNRGLHTRGYFGGWRRSSVQQYNFPGPTTNVHERTRNPNDNQVSIRRQGSISPAPRVSTPQQGFTRPTTTHPKQVTWGLGGAGGVTIGCCASSYDCQLPQGQLATR